MKQDRNYLPKRKDHMAPVLKQKYIDAVHTANQSSQHVEMHLKPDIANAEIYIPQCVVLRTDKK